MINLIKNELIKVFRRKSIIIMFAIILLFTLFSNFMYKFSNASKTSYEDKYIEDARNETKGIDLYTSGEYFIGLKTDIDIYDLKNKYEENSWQRYIVSSDVYEIVSNMNYNKYFTKNNDEYNSSLKEYNVILDFLNNKTWEDYAKYKLNTLEKELEQNKKNNIELENNELKKEIFRIKYRLENNIPYKSDYLNSALNSYDVNMETLDEFLEREKNDLKNAFKENDEKKIYKEMIIRNESNKYMFENKVNLEDTKTARNGMINLFDNTFMFVIIISIMVSGSIVSTEFDKGTIKLLLIRPYSRTKILLSKYITSLLVILISFLTTFILQLIVGTLLFDVKSLKIPVIMYNILNDKIMYINVFRYAFDIALSYLPVIILLSTLGFALSTIINNSVVGVALPLLGFFVSELVNYLFNSWDIAILKYFVTFHWDFSTYLYGGLPMYDEFSLTSDILICIIYLIVMLIPTFIVFKKKNIKNI